MKTIRISIDTSIFDETRRLQSCVVRSAYELACKKYTPRAIELELINKFSKLNGHLFRSGVSFGCDIYNTQKRKNIVFGGKKNLIKRANNTITKEEWKRKRLMPLYSVGRANQKGNIRFGLKENGIRYKDQNQEILLPYSKLKPNWQIILNELIDKSNKKIMPLTYKVGDGFIDIIYDEKYLDCFKKKYNIYTPIKGRVLGIDMNPLNVGISIFDGNKVIHFINFKFEKEQSNSKSKNEYSHIADAIADLCRHYQVEKIAIEDLSIKNQDHNKGKRFNRLVNNKWHRTFFVSKLTSICNLFEIKLSEVNAAYSSFIGNLMYPELPDPCAAATEIARRAHRKYVKGFFYPYLIKKSKLVHRWKEMADLEYDTWVELYTHFKNLKLGFRSSGCNIGSYRFISPKTCVIGQINMDQVLN
jgi:hypothetical protein